MADVIRNIVFDMGNVLLTFDGMRFSRIFTETEEDAELLNRALFASQAWALRDAGALDDETILFMAAHELPERLHPALERAFAGWRAYSEPIEEVNDIALAAHRAGYGVYVLSNAGMCFPRQIANAPARRVFDGLMWSAAEHIMKPDARIYRRFCEKFVLDPASCVFIDDNELNVLGAERIGMKGCFFTGDASELRASLESLGVKLS